MRSGIAGLVLGLLVPGRALAWCGTTNFEPLADLLAWGAGFAGGMACLACAAALWLRKAAADSRGRSIRVLSLACAVLWLPVLLTLSLDAWPGRGPQPASGFAMNIAGGAISGAALAALVAGALAAVYAALSAPCPAAAAALWLHAAAIAFLVSEPQLAPLGPWGAARARCRVALWVLTSTSWTLLSMLGVGGRRKAVLAAMALLAAVAALLHVPVLRWIVTGRLVLTERGERMAMEADSRQGRDAALAALAKELEADRKRLEGGTLARSSFEGRCGEEPWSVFFLAGGGCRPFGTCLSERLPEAACRYSLSGGRLSVSFADGRRFEAAREGDRFAGALSGPQGASVPAALRWIAGPAGWERWAGREPRSAPESGGP